MREWFDEAFVPVIASCYGNEDEDTQSLLSVGSLLLNNNLHNCPVLSGYFTRNWDKPLYQNYLI
jgi:hypothetical protein